MKRVFEWLGGFGLIAFSFYFTDQVSFLVASKSDLMSEIKAESASYKTDAVDAIIDTKDNTIIPGKYGKKVNDKESYFSMHEFGAFNENYLVFTYIKPNTSLEDNKDKYIIGGNRFDRNVSFIVDNENIAEYLTNKNIEYNSILSEVSDFKEDKIEYINAIGEKENFKALTSKLKGKPLLCLKDYSNLNLCLKYNYYIIKPELVLSSYNIGEIKNRLVPGSIILIKDSVSLDHLKILLNEINYKDLNIVFVSKLISEK